MWRRRRHYSRRCLAGACTNEMMMLPPIPPSRYVRWPCLLSIPSHWARWYGTPPSPSARYTEYSDPIRPWPLLLNRSSENWKKRAYTYGRSSSSSQRSRNWRRASEWSRKQYGRTRIIHWRRFFPRMQQGRQPLEDQIGSQRSNGSPEATDAGHVFSPCLVRTLSSVSHLF
jgi:hypothetical protein